MTRVLVVGGVSWDSILQLGDLPEPRAQTVFSRGFHETVGSTGAGKALNLARLGLDVTLHAFVGADPFGALVRERLAAEPLRFVAEHDPRGTERHVNLMADDGRRISIYAAYATFEPHYDAARLEALIADTDVVALNIINYARTLIPTIKRLGKPLWCDIHDWDGRNDYHRDFVAAADVLFMSDGAMPDTPAFMAAQIAAGKSLVVATRGAAGASALDATGRWHHTPAYPVPRVVDTNGAGDAFFSGLLYAHARGHALPRALRLAAIVGARCVSHPELADPALTAATVEGLEASWPVATP